MLLFLLFDSVPDILWLSLAGLVYLAWIEVRREPELLVQVKLWWCLLVFLPTSRATLRSGSGCWLGGAGAPQTHELEGELERQEVLRREHRAPSASRADPMIDGRARGCGPSADEKGTSC